MGQARDLGLLALRVGVGGIAFAHGSQKLFGWFGGGGLKGTGAFFDSVGFRPGGRNALMSGLCEAGGGAALALGLATGPAGAALTGNMIVASSTHYPKFFNAEGGLELPATLGLVGSVLTLIGPGRYSLDAASGGVLNRPWLGAVAIVSAIGSAVYLISERAKVLAAMPAPAESEPADPAAAESGENSAPAS